MAIKRAKQLPLWRFTVGQTAFVRGWHSILQPGRILARLPQLAPFPHYIVIDDEGFEWQVPQILLSSKPFEK